jgi:hypothetical protein
LFKILKERRCSISGQNYLLYIIIEISRNERKKNLEIGKRRKRRKKEEKIESSSFVTSFFIRRDRL